MRIEQLLTFIEPEEGIIGDGRFADKPDDIQVSGPEHQLNAWMQAAARLLVENELKQKFKKWKQENKKQGNSQ